MSEAGFMRHNGDYHLLRDRLRGYFAQHPAKTIARATGADLRTVHGWKSEGRLPVHARHWWALTRAYHDLADVLFNPDQEAVGRRLEAEFHAEAEEPVVDAAPAGAASPQIDRPSEQVGPERPSR
jgi:hypothetical protein